MAHIGLRLVMYPAGHARNTTADLDALLANKWKRLGALASAEPEALVSRFAELASKSAADIAAINDFEIKADDSFIE
ncbi:MAG: hypothetical protein AAF297_09075 [Planctomycetota bacterium]